MNLFIRFVCVHFQLSNLQTSFMCVCVCGASRLLECCICTCLCLTDFWREKVTSRTKRIWDLLFILWFVHVQVKIVKMTTYCLPVIAHISNHLSLYRNNNYHLCDGHNDDCMTNEKFHFATDTSKLTYWHEHTRHKETTFNADMEMKWMTLFKAGRLPSRHIPFGIWQNKDNTDNFHTWQIFLTSATFIS